MYEWSYTDLIYANECLDIEDEIAYLQNKAQEAEYKDINKGK